MQARFYLPMYGRFANPDPARDQHFKDTQSWNIYSYVRNNPVMMIDPSGLLALSAEEKKQFLMTGSTGRPFGGKRGHSASTSQTGTIAIDPGHGDHNNKNKQVDPGAVNGKDYEKDFALNIANSTYSILKDKGYDVLMTRTGDVQDAGTQLQWRIDTATGASIFVSIHINSSESAGANGFSVCYKDGDAASKALAQSILASNTQLVGRGLSARSDLYVLNAFKGTAVLVEAGFISNARDLSVLRNGAVAIGRDIAAGIIGYLGGK
ncbi:hypothetical protein METESE_04280 [Mesoterricola sediminis]|uniref:N-acetylmuramoyl-L-alanine amidase n=2 Tax=Mesoterricola sediminis TaxID=2927980 RepID=A0AA48KBV4_9BACT|nr:hypothetical protein METESE_04280 [Mesoterricola sediminis]